MRNIRVLLSYDGSAFFGWQRQEGFVSVQEAVEAALESLIGEHITVHGAGRTDTGVHALGQTASFHVDTTLDDERLLHALNAHLTEGILVRALETCREEFHAQRDARGKRYLYVVRTTRFRSPLGRKYAHWVPQPLDVAAMREAARYLVGEHDFTSLASAGSPRRSNVRRIQALHLVRRREALLFAVQGTGFLYNMVRAIAGTLIDVGRARLEPAQLPGILAARDRSRAGPTAPAAGLYLVRVLYREACFAHVSPGVSP